MNEFYKLQHELIIREMRKLVTENSEGLLDHLTEQRRGLEITRLTNSLIRQGYFTKEDICKDEWVNNKPGLGGRLAKAVVANIKGDYDEQKYLEERLVIVTREIDRLSDEKRILLKKLNGGK